MKLCPEYWDILDRLAKQGVIFSPVEVKREIEKTEDDLAKWIKDKPYLFKEITTEVQEILREIMAKHGRLVDSIKQRSIADPWVIAFAICEGAIVVQKEGLSGSRKRPKIPDVCQALGVAWMDDFRFAEEVGIRFTAHLRD
jgi:phytoene/squalene synthetase